MFKQDKSNQQVADAILECIKDHVENPAQLHPPHSINAYFGERDR